ncbi:hypothetical protein MBLNU230_g0589t1 [Neophaeotheca triangularis]
MASPPPGYPAASPPASNNMGMSRQRSGLALPTPGAPISRKPSGATSPVSAHPLRQSSFPPENNPQGTRTYSPEAEDPEIGSADDISDSELMGPASSISGPGNPEGASENAPKGIKRKRRGEKKGRGRPPTKDRNSALMRGSSASVANGPEDGGGSSNKIKRSGAPSTIAGGGGGGAAAAAEEEAEDSEEEMTQAPGAGGKGTGKESLYTLETPFTLQEMRGDNANMALFRNTVEEVFHKPNHARRFDAWRQGKLKTTEVRKVVNQTLSQSVPPNVVTTVSAFAKMFAGMLVEGSRGVQAEWEVMRPERADGKPNPANKKLRLMQGVPEESPKAQQQPNNTQNSTTTTTEDPDIQIISPPPAKPAPKSPTSSPAKPNIKTSQSPPPPAAPSTATSPSKPHSPHYASPAVQPPSSDPNLGLATNIHEADRGPLTPDHLREALRRYKRRTAGGVVGFTGLSLQGREGSAKDIGVSGRFEWNEYTKSSGARGLGVRGCKKGRAS